MRYITKALTEKKKKKNNEMGLKGKSETLSFNKAILEMSLYSQSLFLLHFYKESGTGGIGYNTYTLTN